MKKQNINLPSNKKMADVLCVILAISLYLGGTFGLAYGMDAIDNARANKAIVQGKPTPAKLVTYLADPMMY